MDFITDDDVEFLNLTQHVEEMYQTGLISDNMPELGSNLLDTFDEK